MNRKALMTDLVSKISDYKRDEVILLAIDGVDTSGKTFFADELRDEIKNRPIIRISIDGFHNPREVRTRKGDLSPVGYYEDSFNYSFLETEVLKKLKVGSPEIYSRSFDYRSDESRLEETYKIKVPPKAIVIFDGVFLLRERLNKYWDIRVFLDVSFETVIKRAKERDLDYFKDESLLLDKYNKRYIPGQKIYFEREKPILKADIVIDNNIYDDPHIVRCKL